MILFFPGRGLILGPVHVQCLTAVVLVVVLVVTIVTKTRRWIMDIDPAQITATERIVLKFPFRFATPYLATRPD